MKNTNATPSRKNGVAYVLCAVALYSILPALPDYRMYIIYFDVITIFIGMANKMMGNILNCNFTKVSQYAIMLPVLENVQHFPIKKKEGKTT